MDVCLVLLNFWKEKINNECYSFIYLYFAVTCWQASLLVILVNEGNLYIHRL